MWDQFTIYQSFIPGWVSAFCFLASEKESSEGKNLEFRNMPVLIVAIIVLFLEGSEIS